ncbi:hypothetical protein Y032_0096g2955 [Ancylostoma ceylanicum]|uniref:Uncharacterized protein n=1 Tax=Ancylostoma ceylanicum TaxID=53326 RepID=A0A016TKN5_9BILA|nr:hypothetical protein Y032_0096g2955 [Ancylostoma ceylanicum]
MSRDKTKARRINLSPKRVQCASPGSIVEKILEKEKTQEIVPYLERQERNADERHKYSTIVVFDTDYTTTALVTL